ncbi:MAG: hypothetical protein OEY97_10780 [Nitrospirota bacterium]|nr:hypothetical protein [Nitrospirota bacterium]
MKAKKNLPEECRAAMERGSTGIDCPICGEGEIIPTRGRYGLLYACSRRPPCTFWMNTRPTGNLCDYPRDGVPCGKLMMEGTKSIPDRCCDKSCPNHNPHKLARTV